MLLNNEWVTNDIKEEIINYLEKNENEYIIIQNLLNTDKTVCRGKFITLKSFLKYQEKNQITI